MDNRWKVPTRIILDRDRQVNYNGNDVFTNIHRCSECDFQYMMQVMPTKFCPNCGVRYEAIDDISI